MTKLDIIIAVLAILILINCPTKSWSTIYYVDNKNFNGINVNDGTINAPFVAIQKCLDVVEPGDICKIKAGIYYEALVLKKSGNSLNRISLINFEGETVTINSGYAKSIRTGGRRHYYTIEGLRFVSAGSGTNREASLDFEDGIWDGIDNKNGGNNGFIIRNCYIEGAIHFYGHNNLVEGCEVNGLGKWDNGINDAFAVSYNNTYRKNVLYNFNVRGIWTNHLTENIVIEENTIYNVKDIGIDLDGYCEGVYNNVVRKNVIYDILSEGTGIELENSFNSIVEKNYIYNVAREGIEIINYGLNDGCQFESRVVSSNSVIKNNIIYNARKGGIVSYSSPSVKVYGNTIVRCLNGILLESRDGFVPSGWQIKDNIFYFSNNENGIVGDESFLKLQIESDYNNFFNFQNRVTHVFSGSRYTLSEFQGASGLESSSHFEDPAFRSVGTQDFHLKEGSCAIDSGVALKELADDFEGNSRPRGAGYDIGAFESCLEAPGVIPPPTGLKIMRMH